MAHYYTGGAAEGELGRAGGLVSGLMCFHTTFTCSAGFIKQAFELAAEHDVLTHMHCNEGVHEPNYAQEHFGVCTLEYYDQLGVTGPGMLASQCVQVSEREQAIISERGIRVTHMPLSNCEVGGGIAPVPQLVEAGVTLGLGSDGYINDFFTSNDHYRVSNLLTQPSILWYTSRHTSERS